MSGKGVLVGGLAAVLFNPLILLVLLGAGFFVFVVALTVIIVYGLETAIALLLISGLFVVFLHLAHIINLDKQTLFLVIPFLMFLIGYFGQRFSVLAVAPTSQVTLSSQSILAVQLILVAIFFSIGTIVVVRSRRRR